MLPRWPQDAAQWAPAGPGLRYDKRGRGKRRGLGPQAQAGPGKKRGLEGVKMTQETPKVIIMAVVLEGVVWIGGEI